MKYKPGRYLIKELTRNNIDIDFHVIKVMWQRGCFIKMGLLFRLLNMELLYNDWATGKKNKIDIWIPKNIDEAFGIFIQRDKFDVFFYTWIWYYLSRIKKAFKLTL